MSWDEEAEGPMREPETRLRPSKGGWKERADRIGKALEVADTAVDGLQSRIDPVLRPEQPSPAIGGVPSDPDVTSELGSFLDYMDRRVRSLGERLSDLSARVDL